MRVIWALTALKDREVIFDYITQDNPQVAIRIDELFSEAATKLANFPMLGHMGTIHGTREWIVHESYRMVYEVDDQSLRILAIVHTARQWP